MNLRAAFLAQDASQNADGTFMVWRGGITDFGSTNFPVLITAALVLRVEADAEESRRLHRIRIRVVQGGAEHPWSEMPMAFREPAPDQRAYLNLLVNLHLGIREPGAGRVELAVDDELIMPHIPFTVMQAPVPPGLLPRA